MDNSGQEQRSKSKPILNALVKFVLPLALGIVIIYYLLKDINMDELWATLQNANWAILLFSLVFGLLGNTIRGYRWELLIRPLGYTPKVSNLNFAIYGGYAVNFALPRAGEIWRCGMVTKEEKIPFPKLVGTIILDRVLDTLLVLILLFVAFLFNMEFFKQQLEQNEHLFNKLMEILSSPFPYIIIIIGLITTFAIFKYFRENFIVKKVRRFVSAMWQDMVAIWQMKTKNRLFLYSIGIWVSYFLYFYVTFYAFDFTTDLGITAGLTAFALSSLSMGIPSNGGLGPWQVAVVASLTLYGVNKTSATAFATGVFALQSLWVIACGLFGIAALSIRNRNNK